MPDGTIRAFRRKWNLSVGALAEKVGVSRMTIYRWECEKSLPHGNHYEKLKRIMRSYEEAQE